MSKDRPGRADDESQQAAENVDVRIPVYKVELAGNEIRNVMECLESGWISSKGRFVLEFEKAFATAVEAAYAVSTCNGTAALHLAFAALGLKSGDEVIVPTLTYVASVNAVSYVGAKPVFCDSLPNTLQIDPDQVRKLINKRTRAILAVHLYGHPCDLSALKSLAKEHGLFLVEDCAEALGTRYAGRHVGTYGDIAAYSFYGNKTITTGEGGMVTTNDPILRDRVTILRGQGLTPGREYWHDVIGFNYRMTNICAAIGLAQLAGLSGVLQRKQDLASWYSEALVGTPVAFHQPPADGVHSYWMVSLLVDSTVRQALRQHLDLAEIETRPFFAPVHTMPMYEDSKNSFPVAEDLSGRGINLPSWPGLTRAQVTKICDEIRAFYSQLR